MLDVQHLVIKDVLNKPLRHIGRIECLADRDAVVNVVVVPEDAFRATLRPGNRWLGYRAVKILSIQPGKHSIKVINLTLRGRDHLSSASTPRKIG